MISEYQAYKAGYVTGRFIVKTIKFYFMTKAIETTISKTVEISAVHKIDSENPAVITENIFECLQYID